MTSLPEEHLRKTSPDLPEMSEIELVRHYTGLSRKNFGVDLGFYPLGSCTMKYNPKVNEAMASLPGFTGLHPHSRTDEAQGTLSVMYELERCLCDIFGFDSFTLAPCAGAHGEFTALLIAKKYFASIGQPERKKIIVPDSSHGTNPASAALAGFELVSIRSTAGGEVDRSILKETVASDTAMMMLTNPNTLGLFDRNILEIADVLHKAGALFYMDGANANAILGKVKPAEIGFDISHINLHKTFSTPHGGGGPGSGPVGVVKKLEPFLPVPRVIRTKDGYSIDGNGSKDTIGRVSAFFGNVGILLRAYTYIRSIGRTGLKKVSETAVLNANYLMERLKGHYYLPHDRICQHEFVLSAKWQKEKYGIKALDIAKRLIDYGFHPPTIYFPLIVEEAMMIEPTETETLATLDSFAGAMIAIAKECETDPERVKNAPHTTQVSRLDEVKAVKDMDVCCRS